MSEPIQDRLLKFEKNQKSIGDDYGAELLYRARHLINELESALAAVTDERDKWKEECRLIGERKGCELYCRSYAEMKAENEELAGALKNVLAAIGPEVCNCPDCQQAKGLSSEVEIAIEIIKAALAGREGGEKWRSIRSITNWPARTGGIFIPGRR